MMNCLITPLWNYSGGVFAGVNYVFPKRVGKGNNYAIRNVFRSHEYSQEITGRHACPWFITARFPPPVVLILFLISGHSFLNNSWPGEQAHNHVVRFMGAAVAGNVLFVGGVAGGQSFRIMYGCVLTSVTVQLSSIKRSRVLCYFIRLLLELLVSVLRFPIRCLASVRLCESRHVYEFVNLTQDVTQVRNALEDIVDLLMFLYSCLGFGRTKNTIRTQPLRRHETNWFKNANTIYTAHAFKLN